MEYKVTDIKKGIKLHTINTNKFKTNIIAVFLTMPISRETVTKNAVLSSVLRRGSKTMPTQEQISKELEEMYGASFDCGLDKTGDNHIIKFYLESINDNFLPQSDEKMLKTSIEKLLDIVCNPLVENNGFKKEYVEQEKENIKQIIEGKKDNRAKYAMTRCIEEMYKDKPFGLFKFGYVEDLNDINEENLYDYYKELINECKIDIFVSGEIGEDTNEYLLQNENIKSLNARTPNFNQSTLEEKEIKEPNIIHESMDVTQGKLIIGLDLNLKNDQEKYNALMYNSILGGTANSKLFQNVREKESLAYVASSSYLRYKSNIIINCGIEIKNYEKALNKIKEQLEDMKNGNFTDEDIDNSKKVIISTIKSIDDEQDTEITYFFGQELTGNETNLEEYIQKIEKVKREDIINIANNTNINTIYFLKD
ncbi:MAG: insulinase family protein [Clostridia bacterium]|nr:insulinase family protein [Clostridia bacterium]